MSRMSTTAKEPPESLLSLLVKIRRGVCPAGGPTPCPAAVLPLDPPASRAVVSKTHRPSCLVTAAQADCHRPYAHNKDTRRSDQSHHEDTRAPAAQTESSGR